MRRVLVVGLLAVTVLGLAGCSGGSKHSAAETSGSASARPSVTPSLRTELTIKLTPAKLTAQQKPAVAAVEEYWRRYGAAVSTQDVRASGLAGVVTPATGLSSTKKVVANLKAKGEHYQGTLMITVRSVEFGGMTANVDACIDQSRSKLVDKHGTAVSEPTRQNVLPVSHTLVKQGKTWLIDRIDQGGFTC